MSYKQTVDRLIKQYEHAKNARSNWENHWQEIADRVFPRYADHFNSNVPTAGQKRTAQMVDATAALGLERFAAAMESMLTPRNSKWHILKTSDPVLMKKKAVADWFEKKTNLLFQLRYGSQANYASQRHESYLQMGAFGTGALFTDQALDRRGFRFRAVSISNVYFLENFQGIIDKAYRVFKYTAEQAIEHFGADNLHTEINKAFEKDPNKKFEFLHAVIPNNDLEPEKLDYRGKRYYSCYIDIEHKLKVMEDGYNTFPYSVNRYVTTPQEIYGRSPAMMALPAIKTLNKQKEHVLMQGERAVRPPLLAHDDGIIDEVDLNSGAVTYGGINATGQKLVQPMDFGSNLSVGFEMMDQERQVINDFFLVSLFQILTDSPQMTATEVLERAREKGSLVSPTMGRQQSETLTVEIEREVDIMTEQGLMDDMPPELIEAEGEYEIEYDSPLTRSMKAEEASGIARYMEMAGMHANLTGDASMMDLLDPDAVGYSLAETFAVPSSFLRAPEEVQAVREGRAEAAQEQQMIEAAPAMVGAAKAMQ